MSFKLGQKVVCLVDKWEGIQKHQECTVQMIAASDHGELICVLEAPRWMPALDFCPVGLINRQTVKVPFKVGDKVSCQDADQTAGQLVLGREYIIVEMEISGLTVMVQSQSDIRPSGRWNLERFQLLESTAPIENPFARIESFFRSVPAGNCPCNIPRPQCKYHS